MIYIIARITIQYLYLIVGRVLSIRTKFLSYTNGIYCFVFDKGLRSWMYLYFSRLNVVKSNFFLSCPSYHVLYNDKINSQNYCKITPRIGRNVSQLFSRRRLLNRQCLCKKICTFSGNLEPFLLLHFHSRAAWQAFLTLAWRDCSLWIIADSRRSRVQNIPSYASLFCVRVFMNFSWASPWRNPSGQRQIAVSAKTGGCEKQQKKGENCMGAV